MLSVEITKDREGWVRYWYQQFHTGNLLGVSDFSPQARLLPSYGIMQSLADESVKVTVRSLELTLLCIFLNFLKCDNYIICP